MKRTIPHGPSAPPLPIPRSPSSYGRPTDIVSYHHDTVEFDATESMSFAKYILATNSSSRRLRCSRHRNGYIGAVRLAATRFAEIPENRDSRIATSLARRVEEGRGRGLRSPVLDPPRAMLHRSVFLSRHTETPYGNKKATSRQTQSSVSSFFFCRGYARSRLADFSSIFLRNPLSFGEASASLPPSSSYTGANTMT